MPTPTTQIEMDPASRTIDQIGTGYPVADKADALHEYVAAGSLGALGRIGEVLNRSFDDVSAKQGPFLYDLMLQDAAVAAAFSALKVGVLAGGVDLMPAVMRQKPKVKPNPGMPGRFVEPVDPEHDARAAQAEEICDFCQRCIDRMDVPLDESLYALLDSLAEGSKLAEQVYRLVDDGQDKGKLTLKALKDKPRRSWQYVVDTAMNVQGILGVTVDHQLSTVIPREKFAVMTWNPKDSDPRGRSILRAAYPAWSLKVQLWLEYFKYLSRFASPSLVGECSIDAQSRPNAAGVEVAPETDLANSLLLFQNGTVLGVPNGTKITPIEVKGEGQAFLNAIDLCDRQIVLAILGSTRSILEAKNGSKADSETSDDGKGILVRRIRKVLARVVEWDVLYRLVLYNYGKELADTLTPKAVVGATEHQDVAKLLDAFARVGYTVDKSQLMEIDSMVGIEPRDPETLLEPDPTPLDNSGGVVNNSGSNTANPDANANDPNAPPSK